MWLFPAGAYAQCVMCFRTAAAQQAERARVLNAGIIVMMIPPILILAGFLVLAYKRSKSYGAYSVGNIDEHQGASASLAESTSRNPGAG